MILVALGGLVTAIWVYLLLGRGFFWNTRLAPTAPEPAHFPRVVAVIPARNEAEGVGRAVASLLDQDYAGDFSIVLVDDHSHDGTAEVAREAARGREDRLTIVAARSLPGG